jgi:hypothetical protein
MTAPVLAYILLFGLLAIILATIFDDDNGPRHP